MTPLRLDSPARASCPPAAPGGAPSGRSGALPPAAVVEVSIRYCEPGNHERVARRLAAALAEEFRGLQLDVALLPALGGLFEVEVDGRLVYSKKATLRFPTHDEIHYHVRAAAGIPLSAPANAG